MRLPIAAAAAVLIASTAAAADDSYAGQIVFADAVSSMTFVLTGTTQSQGFTILGAAGLALGGPLVHFAHERSMRSVASLGLRIGLTAGGAWLGMMSAQHCTGSHQACGARQADRMGRGAAVGAVAAMLTDSLLVAHF